MLPKAQPPAHRATRLLILPSIHARTSTRGRRHAPCFSLATISWRPGRPSVCRIRRGAIAASRSRPVELARHSPHPSATAGGELCAGRPKRIRRVTMVANRARPRAAPATRSPTAATAGSCDSMQTQSCQFTVQDRLGLATPISCPTGLCWHSINLLGLTLAQSGDYSSGHLEWSVWITSRYAATNAAGIGASTVPQGAGRSLGLCQLGRAGGMTGFSSAKHETSPGAELTAGKRRPGESTSGILATWT